jgi:hypothetical protein
MRGLSKDPVHRAASNRGRSPSPKSLVDDHEQVEDLDHDVSTRTNMSGLSPLAASVGSRAGENRCLEASLAMSFHSCATIDAVTRLPE